MQSRTGAGTSVIEGLLDMRVRERVALTDDVVHLVLEGESRGPLPAWAPGAHIDLVLSDLLVRQYSLCGDPRDTGRYEIAVLKEREGRGGSAFVHDELTVDSPVGVRGPRNHFALVDGDSYLFIAGGIGITPILPMIEAVARSGRPWRLAYGGRSLRSMAFGADLAARHGERVRLWPQDELGLLPLDDLLTSTADGTVVYSCGPEPLLVAVEERCASLPPEAVHMERFSPKSAESFDADGAFVIELAQSGVSIPVPAGANVLDRLEASGIDVMTSCHEGTCGTCMTTVLGGVPDHRDSVLTATERASNDVILPCVSRCLSDTLVLDL
ncbi:PDR/VanB family oxidoreductase [Streptomyces solisilvae]|uniref:PDR/VanB family oxidoreductase n=1 Tax=Streptomyces malaysiensis TaxID=92644 RepID=UPI0036A56582